ncbi:hypothetical protein FSHL1_009725 [Fusarium sambucinum]
MTARNLNKTWRDIIFEQYEADYASNVPFLIRYLIYGDQWKTDILIEILNKIDEPVFRQALLRAASSRRLEKDPEYQDDLIKVQARDPPSTQSKNSADSQDNYATASSRVGCQ